LETRTRDINGKDSGYTYGRQMLTLDREKYYKSEEELKGMKKPM
jgi:hypothetical protein